MYKLWDEDLMKQAVEAVRNDGHSIRRAAAEYNVPHSPLADHISGKVVSGASSGPLKYLLDEEELVQFLIRCNSIGYAKSCKDVLALVQRVLDSRGVDKVVTTGWWQSCVFLLACTMCPTPLWLTASVAKLLVVQQAGL